jgi:hypothetical protein
MGPGTFIVRKIVNVFNKLIKLIKATMDNTVAEVKVQTEMTELFEIRDGLKQGDGLAPLQFTIAVEYVVRKVKVDENTTLQYKLRQIVGYADDICLTNMMKEVMMQTYDELKKATKEVGLSFNANKTKIMVQSRYERNTGKELEIGGIGIDVVDEFVYLGTCITKHRDELKNINRRMGLANKAYYFKPPIMKSREAHRQTKI